MAKIPMREYVVNGDFEGAIERYNHTTAQMQSKWWQVLVEIYDKFSEWSKKYILDKLTRTIKSIVDNVDMLIHHRDYSRIIIGDKVKLFPHGTEQIYLIRLYNEDDGLVYSKYGTTSRYAIQRMLEHLKNYKKDGVTHLRIDRIYDCGSMYADYYESMIRCYLLKNHKEDYIRTDRFKTEFDLEEIDELFEKWKAEIEN